MFNNQYFYNKTTRKVVAVFGTLFNNINVGRIDGNGKLTNIKAVPIAVTLDGYIIKIIKNPSEGVQIAAVTQNGYTIESIKNPSERVQIAAVTEDGYAIKYIDNPSERVQLAAVNKYGNALEYIKNPTQRVKDFVKNK